MIPRYRIVLSRASYRIVFVNRGLRWLIEVISCLLVEYAFFCLRIRLLICWPIILLLHPFFRFFPINLAQQQKWLKAFFGISDLDLLGAEGPSDPTPIARSPDGFARGEWFKRQKNGKRTTQKDGRRTFFSPGAKEQCSSFSAENADDIAKQLYKCTFYLAVGGYI